MALLSKPPLQNFLPNHQIPALPSLEIATRAMEAAIDQKGLDVRGLELQGHTNIADCFVIVSGTSDRHVRGIVDKIVRDLEVVGESPQGISGYENGQWILVDYGDVIVHVFFEPVRQYYSLDELWGDANRVDLSPELEKMMRKLRTGIFPI